MTILIRVTFLKGLMHPWFERGCHHFLGNVAITSVSDWFQVRGLRPL